MKKSAVKPTITPPRRSPSGKKLRPPSRAERAAAAKRTEEQEMQVVKAYRIRLGATEQNWRDQRWSTALGQFCLKENLSPELFQAGERYGEIVNRWRALKALPGEHDVDGSRTGIEPSAEALARAGAQMHDAQRHVEATEGVNRLTAIRRLVLENHLPETDIQAERCYAGLMALAVHFGMIARR